MDEDPPESPKHSDHAEESTVFANLGTNSPIRPANAQFNPDSFSELAPLPLANQFTGSNSSWRRRLSLTGSSFGDHPSDLLRDNHSNSSVDSNSETGEMETGLPPFEKYNSIFENIPENAIFLRSTTGTGEMETGLPPYNLQVQEPTFDQRPPKPQNARSRKTLFNMTGNYSDKHCKCTKTACMNRYCECFSDKVCCDELCTCQGCYNRDDYEDTVQDAKEKIEKRNPNAFRSKIQHQDANVRGSDVCRCKNCENTRGKKAECLDKKHEMVAPKEALMHNDMSSIPQNRAPPTASPFQFSNYAEAARNSWYEPAGPRPPTMATSYGMSLPMQSSTFPANNFYSDVLMRSGTRFDMQMQYDYPGVDPMNPFSQNLNQFGNPYLVFPMPDTENWVNNATNAGMFSHIGQNPTANTRMFPHIGQNPTTNARNPTANARMFPHIGQNPTTNVRNPTANAQIGQNPITNARMMFRDGQIPTANARMFSHIGQIPTANAQMFSHNGQNPTANAGMFPHIGQNPTANARMLSRNSQIPTNVNPFHRENLISGYGGGVSSIGNRRDAAHQMLEESPVPPYAFRGVTRAPAPAPAPAPTRLNRITSSAAAVGDMSGYNYILRNNAVQVVTPYASRVVTPAPAPTLTPTPLNPITSSSSAAAAAADLSGYPYLLRDVPSSKGFDGHAHTAKKD